MSPDRIKELLRRVEDLVAEYELDAELEVSIAAHRASLWSAAPGGGGVVIAVKAGQVYRCRRPGKPARHVRIARVSRGNRGQCPIAYYQEVTRSGRQKSRESVRHFLTFDGRRWVMAPGFELAEVAGG